MVISEAPHTVLYCGYTADEPSQTQNARPRCLVFVRSYPVPSGEPQSFPFFFSLHLRAHTPSPGSIRYPHPVRPAADHAPCA
jgi:hypothetical protein